VARANWAGNYTYSARTIHRPTSVEEAQEVIAASERIHVLGSGHSFTAIADSAELVSLAGLPERCAVDSQVGGVRVSGSIRYGELAERLCSDGLGLANLASLPHISVAGAVATATHGSGEANGNLATAVSALELITSDGEIVKAERGDPGFDGIVVGLGALGAVLALTLDVEPGYAVSQFVYEDMGWDALFEHFDEIMGSGYSVSVFTLWEDPIHQVWVKRRAPAPDPPPALFGARAASEDRHPIPGLDPKNATPQLGRPGPWSDRLPHFRMGFTPSSGEEIQSEYLVPRAAAVAAIAAVRELGEMVRPLLQVSEIRAIAADSLWMSPQYEVDTIGIHFTWKRDQAEVERVLGHVEAALRPFGARPHWGKLFLADAREVGPLYPRVDDFRRLRERLDPRDAFRNAWLDRHVLGFGP
jgi:alditol oxidase